MQLLYKYMQIFVVAAIIFVVIDILWLGFIMRSFYSIMLGTLARRAADGSLMPHIPSALGTYFLLIAGLYVVVLFCIKHSVSVIESAYYGGFVGLIIYGVYEGTNYSVLADWPWQLVLIDTIWGIILFSLSTVFTLAVARMFIVRRNAV